MKIHDVSLEISEGMVVYPNNTPPRINFIRLMPEGSSNLSEVTLGSHTGTHVDSLLHVKNGVAGVEALPTHSFVGPSRVIDLTHVEDGIGEEDLVPHRIRKAEIVVLKTKNSLRGYTRFYSDFVHLTEGAASYLVHRRVKTIGHDYLSVQKFKAGSVNVHRVLSEGGVTIFEGLDLSGVTPGRYWFVGLPLRIRAESAPARVLLIER